MKKLRLTLYILLAPVALAALLVLLVYVPPVQNFLVKTVARIASRETGMQIEVEQVRLAWPLNLAVNGVLVAAEGDTIAHVSHTVVDVKLWPLFRQNVVVNCLDLNHTQLNTKDFISDCQLVGRIARLNLTTRGIDLARGNALLKKALLDGAHLTVLLSDTAATDTTSAPTLWRIAFDEVAVTHSNICIHFPGDSLQVSASLGKAIAQKGDINLATNRFSLGNIALTHCGAHYADYHISDLDLRADSLLYDDPNATLHLAHLSMKERSGWQLTHADARASLDKKGIHLTSLNMATPSSTLNVVADADYSVTDSIAPGQMALRLNASIGKGDLRLASRFLPSEMKELVCAWPLNVSARLNGNTDALHIAHITLDMPTVLHAEMSGDVHHLLTTSNLAADLQARATTWHTAPLTRAAGIPSDYQLPNGLTLKAQVTARGAQYAANIAAADGKGRLTAKASFNGKSERYAAKMNIAGLNLHHFMPHDSLFGITAKLEAKGRGFDFTRKATTLDAHVQVERLHYGKIMLDSISAQASLKDGHAEARLVSENRLIHGLIAADALMAPHKLRATLTADLRHANLKGLGVAKKQVDLALCGHIDVDTDFKHSLHLDGHIGDISIIDSLNHFRPKDITAQLHTSTDTTYAQLHSGTFEVKLGAGGGLTPLAKQLSLLVDSAIAQAKNREIDQKRLQRLLPNMHLYVSSGRNNPVANIIKAMADIDFQDFHLNMATSAPTGIDGEAHIFSLNYDSVRIDTMRITVLTADRGITFKGQVTNNKRNPQFVFNSKFSGYLFNRGAYFGVRYYDASGKLGVSLGTKAETDSTGLHLQLLPERPVIGYKTFKLNKDNFLHIDRNLRLQAKVDLMADDGTGVKIYSENQDSTLLQDLTVSLCRFDLGQISAVTPYMPRITGMLDGDFHLMMDDKKQISVASDMGVNKMTYEDNPIGNLGLEFVYLGREDNTHAVEGTVSLNDREVGQLSGQYLNEGDGALDATLELSRTPLPLVNGFIPDGIIGLEGYADGSLSVKGKPAAPVIDGELMLDSAWLVSKPYGVKMRFDNDPVAISASRLMLENFTMYANNDNPLNISGNLDFTDFSNINMNLKMKAQNFLLIDSKRQRESVAYGKAYVNFYAAIAGPMERLTMKGKMDVLGSTNLVYTLLDSPLSTDNRMDELVKFADFNDSTPEAVSRPVPQGFNMTLALSIDPGAHVLCNLNADESNYVDLFGGGDLRMNYGDEGIALTGRYTLSNGSLKYSLPVIPLKTFNIEDGSYVEFTGDPFNPRLNITATERTRATVADDGGQSRSVLFNCGVIITKTLSNMGLEFTVNSPEDINLSSQLQAMSPEQRGKIAVTMLTTGMYLADGNMGGFSMNSALSSFLQGEINNITGSALKTLDLSIGLDNSTDASGDTHTDYSFRFAKRFWNNRLNVQLGGKVSTAGEANGQEQSFFDNVTMEYRLSQNSNKYVKLFYNQNVYDWLEGYTGEYGGGFIYKRKLNSLWDVFKSSKKQ